MCINIGENIVHVLMDTKRALHKNVLVHEKYKHYKWKERKVEKERNK